MVYQRSSSVKLSEALRAQESGGQGKPTPVASKRLREAPVASRTPSCDNPRCVETRKLLQDFARRVWVGCDDLEDEALLILDRLTGWCAPDKKL